MGWQLLTAVAAFLLTGRAVLFLLGIFLGGMLTVASPQVLALMTVLVGWWDFLISALFG